MKTTISIILFMLTLVACTGQQTPPVTPVPVAFFPLAKGTYWVYEGAVLWQNDSPEIHEITQTLKMEVLDVITRNQVHAYLLKGHPSDLAWYQEGQELREHVIIQVENKYYLTDAARTWPRLQDKEDYLIDLVSASELFLETPLVRGNSFGETEQLTRLDTSYRWFVEEEKAVTLTGVEGVLSGQPGTQYSLRFQTLPDHAVIQFVPGIGITGYEYNHHGSVSRVNVKLIAYHPGQ